MDVVNEIEVLENDVKDCNHLRKLKTIIF
jgi:hypothetical protein